jgi:hypothetical protein
MQNKLLFVATTLALGVALGVFAGRPVAAQEASRYPYDPVCPWGRLSNGKGMLVRCLVEAEANQLLSSSPPRTRPSSSAAPSAASSSPSPATTPDEIKVEVGPVTADEGTLPQAEKKLSLAKEKLVGCLADNGGLEKDSAEVVVRFLVRARGRAEGVSVAKRTGLGAKAASCVADVVDRRFVGTPAAPMVGATAVFKFSRVSR